MVNKMRMIAVKWRLIYPSCRIQLPACTSSVTRPIVFVSPFTPLPRGCSLCFVSSMYFARAFGKASTNALRAQRANARLINRVASPAVAVKGNYTNPNPFISFSHSRDLIVIAFLSKLAAMLPRPMLVRFGKMTLTLLGQLVANYLIV